MKGDAIARAIVRTGRGVRVAIIDSGVHAAHPHVRGVAGGVAIAADGREHHDYVDGLGHGTAVAAVIKEKAPDAELFAVKVFERVLATEVAVLVRAIEWAMRSGMRLVNLSLGTARPDHENLLRAAVRRARNAGMVIVSARDADGTTWLPGALPGVVPVQVDWACPRDRYRVVKTSEGEPLFRASGFPREIPGVPPERNLKGLSFAVANMTGFVACALEGRPDASFEQVVELLSEDSIGTAPSA